MARILVVDDENGPRQALRMLLNEKYEVVLAENATQGLGVLKSLPVDLIITDLRMPDVSGVELLQHVKQTNPDVEVIILTGYGQLDTAMKAVEYGAFAYIEKPFDNDDMLRHVDAALDKRSETLERRQLERLALEANRFETLGRVVSGMIHDLGTPLSVIGSNIEFMMLEARSDTEKDRLETMFGQIVHCRELIRNVMGFLRQQPQSFVSLDINNVLENSLEVARPFIRQSKTDVIKELNGDIPLITGDFVSLRQAILNLIVNACQEMENNTGPRMLRVTTFADATHVNVLIADNGPGIPQELHERVFDTFYTTKGDQGTGIGLAVARAVMRRHKGRISIEQNTPAGAIFHLTFPIHFIGGPAEAPARV